MGIMGTDFILIGFKNMSTIIILEQRDGVYYSNIRDTIEIKSVFLVNGNIKRYNYNNNNNLKEYITALGNTQKYEYDTDNNLIKEIDPRNKVKKYI